MTWPIAFLLSGAWLAGVLFSLLRVRFPRPLMKGAGVGPFVSVVVPARNEERNIRQCLESICRSDYAGFEVIVVDDRSEDRTGQLPRGVDPDRASRVEVVEGAELPDGWMGKPWACHQGVQAAKGELLLFTDADTRHAPELLGDAVASLHEDRAEAVTLLGTQEMVTFWERLVQPQIFYMMMQLFPDTRRPFEARRWRRAIANGQYILIRRSTYEAIGGHETVKDQVVEDLRLAQILTRSGRTLVLRDARSGFTTRMYHSLGELVRGWSKNSSIATRQVLGPVLGMTLILASLVLHPVMWLLPPAVLLVALVGGLGAPVTFWAAAALGAGILQWGIVSRRSGIPAAYGALHPLGAVVTWYIILRSALRGSRVEWKGREYRASAAV